MGRNLIVGLALLVSVLATGIIGGCAATPKLIQQKRDEAAIIFRPSGKDLRRDIENAIRQYRGTHNMPDNKRGYGHNRTVQPDTSYLRECVDDAMKRLTRYGREFMIYVPAQPCNHQN